MAFHDFNSKSTDTGYLHCQWSNRPCEVDIYRVSKKKGRSQNIIVFHELLSLGCINFKNLCGHHQEEVLRFPKHPQLVKFG